MIGDIIIMLHGLKDFSKKNFSPFKDCVATIPEGGFYYCERVGYAQSLRVFS